MRGPGSTRFEYGTEMIVRPLGDRIHLITQPDHARLGRTIMERSVPLATRLRRESILHAVARHDDGWALEDAAPTVNIDTGEVVDFVRVPVAVRQATSLRGIPAGPISSDMANGPFSCRATELVSVLTCSAAQ